MSLLDTVSDMLSRLNNSGWGELLFQHGLDINSSHLREELLRPLTIDRSLDGFEDFSLDGNRAIEPGKPGQSLLYHALASPNVQRDANGQLLQDFPSLADIDALENLIFGIEPLSLQEVRNRFVGQPLSVVVFACDYRPAIHTAHRRYADLTFSRTGISRVGTAVENYEGRVRGFMPFIAGEHKGIRVLPCRYSAYLAVKQSGNEHASLPMRFRHGDATREFWQPVHKLFDGDECLSDFPSLRVTFSASHINEKLRRIHLKLDRDGTNTGVSQTDLDRPPYRLRQGLAELSIDPQYPPGTLVPVPHESLVETAMHNGQRAVFPVPGNAVTLSSSLFLSRDKSAPEFVHARHKVNDNGAVTNLNNWADVEALVQNGGFNAQHYLDFSADGVVSAEINVLEGAAEITSNEAAYSLVCAPDFYPQVDQRELTDWTEKLTGPVSGAGDIWKFPPRPLCDERLSPNLVFPDYQFPEEETVTAVVNLHVEAGQAAVMKSMDPMRHSGLPDDAAGVFDPGWDVSTATNAHNVEHLANHGLGSPFPEDAKLCAAITAFWPAVAPDIARSIQPMTPGHRMRTVTPLTDEEIGLNGGVPWDGIEPLRIVNDFGGTFIEYAAFDQTDYVEQALNNELTVALIGKLSVEEYQHRVLAMAIFYRAINRHRIRGHGPDDSLIFSFRKISPSDSDLLDVQRMTNSDLGDTVYRIMASSRQGRRFVSTGEEGDRRVRIRTNRLIRSFVSPVLPLGQRGEGILLNTGSSNRWRFLNS